jgi:hypothetical protein
MSGPVVLRPPSAAARVGVGLGEPTIEVLREDNRALREEVERSRVATRTLASVAVALARLVNDERGRLDREIVIPRDVYDRLAGCEVGVSEDPDRNIVVRIRDNLTHPVWEGR